MSILPGSLLALAIAATPQPARAEDGSASSTAAGTDGAWSFAAVPRLTLSSDDGVGLGARGTAFWHRWNASPYKTAISFQAWATSSMVQHHFVRVDAVDALNVPLRLEAEAGLFQTLSANFCGVGSKAACDDHGAGTRVRFIAPYASTMARLRVMDRPRIQLVAGTRQTALVPGTWDDATPFPGTPYAAARPRGERGLVSQALAGALVDTRDFEPAPTNGLVLSLVLRAADPLIGSTWRFGGANAQALVFSRLHPRVVLAQRALVDVLMGDAPLIEQMKVVGLQESFAWGGQDLGRGLRLTRAIGAVKLLAQEEVRVQLVDIMVAGNALGLGVAGFLDIGVVEADLPSLTRGAPRPLWGAGLALRASWNRTFVMRVEFALSPDEGARVGLYTAPAHPF